MCRLWNRQHSKTRNGASECEVVGFCLGAQLYKTWLHIFLITRITHSALRYSFSKRHQDLRQLEGTAD